MGSQQFPPGLGFFGPSLSAAQKTLLTPSPGTPGGSTVPQLGLDDLFIHSGTIRRFGYTAAGPSIVQTAGLVGGLTTLGAQTAIVTAQNDYQQWANAGGVGAEALVEYLGAFYPEHQAMYACRFVIPTTILNMRQFMGMGTQRPTNVDAGFSAGQMFCAVRYSTVAGDLSWTPFTWDGVTLTVSASLLIPIVQDREQLLIMNYNKGGTVVFFRMWDTVSGAFKSTSMVVPALMRGLTVAKRQGFFINNFANAAGVTQLAYQQLYYEAGNA